MMNRRRRSRSRSRSRERRSSDSRESRHHHHGSSRRHSPDTSSPSRSKRYRRKSRSRSRSRSSSSERNMKNNERSKLQLRQQMARNYEEQIDKIKNNSQFAPVPAPPTNKFLNQVPVEPSKLVEQIEKRKFLFSKKPTEVSSTSCQSTWKQAAFTDDQDGKMTAKFKRLMGIKDNEPTSTAEEKDDSTVKKNLLENLEKQYEIARTTTHTQRGVGLGFSSSSRLYPVIPQRPTDK